MVHSSFIHISIIAVVVLSKITATCTETDFIFSKCQANKDDMDVEIATFHWLNRYWVVTETYSTSQEP